MPNYKLYYFNVTGLAEPIRYLLHYAGVEFEDVRFRDFDDWSSNYKKDMPMEQVPILEIDGVKYHQHIAICRYIAKKFHLYGSDDDEALMEMDAIIEDINDLRLQIGGYFKEKDQICKERLREKVIQDFPFFLEKFESRVMQNGGFFFNNKITWVDIYYAGINEIMSSIMKIDLNENYPNLTKLIGNVRNQESIKKYLAQRPSTLL